MASITREQIKALRREATEAGDYVQVALCEVAMDRHGSAEELCEAHPGLRSKLESLGVIVGNLTSEARAEALCASAINRAKAEA